MTGRRWLVALAIAAVAAALGYAGFVAYRRAQPESCYACQRPIHAHSRTVAVANGRSRLFCCPACALSEHEQEGKPVQVTELTGFLTGAKLSPNDAYVVKGSDVNMCAHAHEMIDADKQPAGVLYDRCSPSLLAFAQRSEAMQFAREHGGEALPFKALIAAPPRPR
jgi:hypothetical protein